mmetsp:Transcript_23868/g.27496  ORF Transcript_23868/g.27496 Transcript_23868/m.27496 type:complete len:804 (+) Transcript_23868:145-2556(+)
MYPNSNKKRRMPSFFRKSFSNSIHVQLPEGKFNRPLKAVKHTTNDGHSNKNAKSPSSPSTPIENPNDVSYLNHKDIRQRAIQIFHTEDNSDATNTAYRLNKWHVKVLHPNNHYRRYFDFFTVVWVLLLMFLIPFDIGFDWYIAPDSQKLFLTLLDFWFAVDILLNFRTGYVHHGTVVMNPQKIASHYLTTWFLIDVLGTLPFEKFVNSGDSTSRKSLKLIKYFKIPKLLRVSRVMKYVRDNYYVYDLVQVFMLIFTLLHIGACVWVGILDPCDELDDVYAGDDVCRQENVYNLYAEAVHSSAVMILGISNFHIVGSHDTLDMLIEKRTSARIRIYVVSTVYMIVGLFAVALLLSEMNVYILGKTQGSAAFQRRRDRVKHEMEYYAVPDDLQLQVRAYFDYIWIHQKQYDDQIALLSDEQMSTDLQRKLALHLFKDVVSHISFFSEIDDLLLGEICLSLRTRIYLPNDMILFKGDVGKELFIVAKGVVEVIRDDLPTNKRRHLSPIFLKNGSFFGEIALVMEKRRTCSVKAKTVCEVNVLQQQAFDTILRERPDFARRMNELVVARQLETRLSQSKKKGVDVKVLKSDLELAVKAVESNMREGLQRRMEFGPMRRQPIKEDPPRQLIDNEQTEKDRNNNPSEVISPDTDFGENEEPSFNVSVNVGTMFDDIAKRSTFVVKRGPPQERAYIGETIDEDESDTESSQESESSENENYPQEYNQTDRFVGHYNPGQRLDIRKVRPSILMALPDKKRKGQQSEISSMIESTRVQSLRERCSLQEKMIQSMLLKIDGANKVKKEPHNKT